MNAIRWSPIVERPPADWQEVIVSSIDEYGELYNFAATYDPGFDDYDPRWMSLICKDRMASDWAPAADDVRATDFWLPIPAEHPQHNAVDGGYPA